VNDLEDRLRDAYRAVADTIDPATVAIPPMSTHRPATFSRWMRILTPLATAAAVTIVVIATTLAGGTSPRHHARTARPRPAAAAAPSLPEFTLVDLGSSVKVYDTRTGAGVAKLTPPAGQQFEDVASGGSPGTFLAATGLSGSVCHAYFYQFHLSATGGPSPLTFLRSVPGSQPTAVIGIPGSRSYAYSTVHCQTAPPNGGVGISGPAGNRTWTYPTGDDYADSLAATADGRTLALSFFVYGPGFQDMLLNTKSSSPTAAGASRTLPSVPVSQTLAISPDGRTLYACASDGTTGTLASYSTATGAQLRVLHQWPVTASGGGAPGTDSGYSSQGFSCQISTDATGRYLLAAVSLDNKLKHWTVTGFDLQTGAFTTTPVRPHLPFRGAQLAW
jgi:WD40 repeat protein